MAVDALGVVYSVLLVGALVKVADWVAPYENLSEAGCRLDYVYDGDTVALDCGGEIETARLIGLDTPETRNPGCRAEAALGEAATLRLREISGQGAVSFSGQVRDKYGRLLVTMRVDGADVADLLIAEDLAVPYRGAARIDWCDRLEG